MSEDARTSVRPMKMSQLSAASGLTVSTIKFYISQGLLPRPEKTKPNVAYYDDGFLKRLQVIKKMRDEGLSVKSIKSILDRYPFEKIADWEAFKRTAREKDARELEEEERLATLSGEERRTDAILDAAFQVFSAKGYNNATVDDIARQAGVSKGTCYQYFSGKEEIFVACMDRTMDKLIADANAAVEDTYDVVARMGIKGLTFISKFKDVQFMFIGLYSEIVGGNERLRKKSADLFHRIATFLAEDIDVGIEQKVFRKMDSITVAYALIGIATSIGNRDLTEDDFDVPGFLLKLTEFMQFGLMGDPSRAWGQKG
ncbi:MAG: TetR family transcriptional regulator [Actinobacteria bacterium]|nr:TetR family transcriptional regulator [Actinomycetota bacterium]MBU1942346.1 TetR family transcriptional regulator [Actinomycetota bacterium]MBU2686340.1 TetR family transcriptional regulator [Actinomycetota bacterium]